VVLQAAALALGGLLALAGSLLVSPGCVCTPGPELYGIPRGTFPGPLPGDPGSEGMLPLSVTVTGSALFLVYDDSTGPVEVPYSFDEPNGPVRGSP
jgi:hypothetical protein